MKKLFFAILLMTSQALAEIHELKSYKDIDLSQIDSDTLVIFDIDNTLIRQNSMVGTHQWGDYFRDRAIAHGLPKADAQAQQYEAFGNLQSHLPVVPVENEVINFLKYLQLRQVPHFALTARASSLRQVTFQQLQILKHDFASSFPEQKVNGTLGDHLYQGIIFSGDIPKGELLKKIIDNSVRTPRKVLFIDDKRYNLESVESSLQSSGLALESLRYGGADSYLQSFDPALADLIYSFYVETGIVFPDEKLKSSLGDLPKILSLRYQYFLHSLGSQAHDLNGCAQTSQLKEPVQYECVYQNAGVSKRIQFEFKKEFATQAIYFGQW